MKSKMTKKTTFILILLAIVQITNGQNTPLIHDEEWEINHYQGGCYHDTIIHAVFLYIDPNQQLKKYDKDTSFVVVEVTAVNKSPIDIYFHGETNRMRVPVVKERYIADTALVNDSKIIFSTMPLKLDKSSAFEMEDYSKNPHKDLWGRNNKESLIKIPMNRTKKLIVTIPKREGDYRIEAIVEFNTEKYAYDCTGQKVSWSEYRKIESNKIELKKR